MRKNTLYSTATKNKAKRPGMAMIAIDIDSNSYLHANRDHLNICTQHYLLAGVNGCSLVAVYTLHAPPEFA
jgi:hypothetical protein